MQASEFNFVCVHLLYYTCHKKNPNHGGLYIDFPDWTKNQKVVGTSMNKKDDKCFQYAVTIALNHEEIEKGSQIISEILSFKSTYNWEEINCSLEKDDSKRFGQNNLMIAVSVLYA